MSPSLSRLRDLCEAGALECPAAVLADGLSAAAAGAARDATARITPGTAARRTTVPARERERSALKG